MRRRSRITSSSRTSVVHLPVADVRAVVASGRRGPQWYADALPLVARGGIDRLLGGAGRRWPAPDRELLEPGDRVAFWTVTRSTADELVLRAEVRAPGEVVLTTRLTPVDARRTRVEQTVALHPSGLLGAAYLVADLPAREAVIELTHRRLLRDLSSSSS